MDSRYWNDAIWGWHLSMLRWSRNIIVSVIAQHDQKTMMTSGAVFTNVRYGHWKNMAHCHCQNILYGLSFLSLTCWGVNKDSIDWLDTYCTIIYPIAFTVLSGNLGKFSSKSFDISPSVATFVAWQLRLSPLATSMKKEWRMIIYFSKSVILVALDCCMTVRWVRPVIILLYCSVLNGITGQAMVHPEVLGER